MQRYSSGPGLRVPTRREACSELANINARRRYRCRGGDDNLTASGCLLTDGSKSMLRSWAVRTAAGTTPFCLAGVFGQFQPLSGDFHSAADVKPADFIPPDFSSPLRNGSLRVARTRDAMFLGKF